MEKHSDTATSPLDLLAGASTDTSSQDSGSPKLYPSKNKRVRDNSQFNIGRWHQVEHSRFLEAIKIYQNWNWRKIAAFVQTRSAEQCRTHAQKVFAKKKNVKRIAHCENVAIPLVIRRKAPNQLHSMMKIMDQHNNPVTLPPLSVALRKFAHWAKLQSSN